MHFLATAWLALLIPWLALCIWLWRRQLRQVGVTGGFLWPATGAVSSRDRERATPPAWVLLSLVSLLLLVLSLAQPQLLVKRPRLKVIVDHHVSMGWQHGDGRVLEELVGALDADLRATGFDPEIDLLLADGTACSRRELPAIRFTAASTSARIEALARATDPEPCIVLSAQRLTLPIQTIHYAPHAAPPAIQIARIGASGEPSPQVMATFSHPSGTQAFDVAISTNGQSIRHRVVPESGSRSTSIFVDIPDSCGDSIEVAVDARYPGGEGETAYLVRRGAWPLLQIDGEVPPQAERFAAVYARQRPAGAGSPLIRFTSSPTQESASICFAAARVAIEAESVSIPSPSGDAEVTVTAVAGEPPRGFEVLARSKVHAVLAVRRGSPGQVWIGFDVAAFAQTRDWVEWLGDWVDYLNESGSPRWESGSVDQIGADWQPIRTRNVEASPGLYRTPDGAQVAVNRSVVALAGGVGGNRERLVRALDGSRRERGVSLVRGLLAGGLLLAGVAGGLLGHRPRLDGRGSAP